MKNILIIAYAFPPSNKAGVYRTLAYVRYLPENGWKPIVLTVPEESYLVKDPELSLKIPKVVEVFRVPYIGSAFDISKGRKLDYKSSSASFRHKVISIIKNKIIAPALIPDKMVSWVLPAYRYAKHLIKQKNIQIIYTTSPFDGVHLVGALLKRTFGIPWIADFRDPWIYPFLDQGKMRKKILSFMEYQVMTQADRVITVSKSLRDDALERHSSLKKEKFIVITNGFDHEDFCGLVYQPTDKFTILHTGVFFGKRSPVSFLLALKHLFTEKPELEHDIRIRFVGGFEPKIEAEAKNTGMWSKLQIVGYVSHEEAIRYQLNSDLLLLIPGPKTLTIPGKAFEYLAAKRPILALTEADTDTAELIRKLEVGTVVHPNDIIQIKNAIYSMYMKYKNGSIYLPDATTNAISAYSRQSLTKKLSEVCDELVDN